MKLDFSEIVTHPGKRKKYQIDEPPIKNIDTAINGVSNIKGELVVTNSGSLIIVQGAISTTVEIECSRCLRPYTMDMTLDIEEGFPIANALDQDEKEEAELSLPEEEKEPLFVSNVFNFSEIVRQSIIVSVPIKTLCSEDCKGLCLRCGQNLNEGQCNCPVEDEESPFAALASLLKEAENKEDK